MQQEKPSSVEWTCGTGFLGDMRIVWPSEKRAWWGEAFAPGGSCCWGEWVKVENFTSKLFGRGERELHRQLKSFPLAWYIALLCTAKPQQWQHYKATETHKYINLIKKHGIHHNWKAVTCTQNFTEKWNQGIERKKNKWMFAVPKSSICVSKLTGGIGVITRDLRNVPV